MFTADAHCDALYRMVTGGRPHSSTPEALARGGVGVQAMAMFAGEDEDRGIHRARPMCEALSAFGLPVITGDMPKTRPQRPTPWSRWRAASCLRATLQSCARWMARCACA